MNRALWKHETTKLLTNKKFILSFAAVFLLYFIDTADKILYYSNIHNTAELPAACLISFLDRRFLTVILTVFAPFFSGIIYSDNYANERNNGIYTAQVTRSGRKIITIKALLVFLSTLITFFLPMMLSQLALLCFAPVKSVALGNSWLYYAANNHFHRDYYHPSLYEGSPYFANAVAMLRTALFFAAMALLMYAVSLFLYKKIWVVVLTGGALYYILSFLLGTLEYYNLVPINYFFAAVNDGAYDLRFFYIYISLMIVTTIILVFIKRKKYKDEL